MIEFYVALGMSWLSGLCIGIFIGGQYIAEKWRKSIEHERSNHN